MVVGKVEPLYMILGCYAGVQYLAVQLAFTFGADAKQNLLRKLGLALFSGLTGRYLWSLLDIVGAHLLWWTWHESDELYSAKICGVPIASSFWILSETACIGLVYALTRTRSTLLISTLMFLLVPVLFNIPFAVLYHPIEQYGRPDVALYLMEAIGVIAALGLLAGHHSTKCSRHLFGIAVAFVLIHLVILLVDRSEMPHKLRYSYGQPFVYRDCQGEQETVFWGTMTRDRFLCPAKMSAEKLYTLNCLAEMPVEGKWYWLCGVGMTFEVFIRIIVEFLKSLVLLLLIYVAKGNEKRKAD